MYVYQHEIPLFFVFHFVLLCVRFFCLSFSHTESFFFVVKGFGIYNINILPQVTALLGKTAYLNCRVKNLGNKTVSI